MLLWLWRRPAATAPIGPLAWEPPHAMGAAHETAKRQKKKKKELSLQTFWNTYRHDIKNLQNCLCTRYIPFAE